MRALRNWGLPDDCDGIEHGLDGTTVHLSWMESHIVVSPCGGRIEHVGSPATRDEVLAAHEWVQVYGDMLAERWRRWAEKNNWI